jgi:hypothetical protein
MVPAAGVVRWYHGTDVDSGLAFLNGMDLDAAEAARRKVDGPPGFFLAQRIDEAAFFALRRQGTILAVDLSPAAETQLAGAGAVRQPIAGGFLATFQGDELVIPPGAFDAFNRLRSAGEIQFLPARWP